MDVASLAFQLIIGFALGAVIGLEREVNEKKSQEDNKQQPTALIGLRSFSLITVLGVITGTLYPIWPGLSVLIGSVYFILLLLAYVFDSWQTKDPGITTELAMIFSFVIGLLLSSDFPIQLTIALTIIVTLLLSQKRKIKEVVSGIKKREVNAFVSFAIVAAVILPFLPNVSYALADIPGSKAFFENIGLGNAKLITLELLNPFKLWLIVVLVIGVDLVGYVLEKVIGSKKGWLLASAAGGFVSSTATTQSLAQESKHSSKINPLISAAILANIVSFVQIAFLIGFVNSILLIKLLPILGVMMAVGFLLLFYFLFFEKKAKETDQKEIQKNESEKIIDIGAGVKFAFLFLAISIISKVTLELYGSNGFFVATGIGALLGLDAVMINTAQLAGGQINYQIAGFAFILANAVNLFGKSFYSYLMGKKEFAAKFFISMLLIVISSLVGILFI